ncbi:unnamed protein product, partial [Pylaiella littoralis]
MSAASSHKHKGAVAVAAAAKRHAPEGTASRRRQPQDSKRDAAKRRAGPFPRRPQPTEKPRFAPPHSTRTVRAAVRATGRGKVQDAREKFAGNDIRGEVVGGGDGAGSNGSNRTQIAAATTRATRGRTSVSEVQAGREGRMPAGDEEYSWRGSGRDSGLTYPRQWTPCSKERSASRRDTAAAPRRARCVTRRGRRDAATKALVRVPGHDRRRPYSNFHQFKRMEQETRDIFFSLGGSIGGARVNDNRVAGRGQQGTEASRDNACAAAGSGQQNKTEIAAHGRNTDQPLFSAYFGTKQAWTSVQEPAIRTQGPYLGKNWGARRETSESKRHLSNLTRWAVIGAKV